MNKFVKITIVVIVVLVSMLIVSVNYLINEENTQQVTTSARNNTSSIVSNTLTTSKPVGETTSLNTNRVEVEQLTLYRLATYYEKLVYNISRYNSTLNDLIDTTSFGYYRLNVSSGGIVYVRLFTANITSYIVDLIVGIDENDNVVSVSGSINGVKISGESGRSYALDVVTKLKTILMLRPVYGDEHYVRERLYDMLSREQGFNITGVKKTRVTLSTMVFDGYIIVLKPMDNTSEVLNKTYVYAELLQYTWLPVRITAYYVNGEIQVYEITEIRA